MKFAVGFGLGLAFIGLLLWELWQTEEQGRADVATMLHSGTKARRSTLVILWGILVVELLSLLLVMT